MLRPGPATKPLFIYRIHFWISYFYENLNRIVVDRKYNAHNKKKKRVEEAVKWSGERLYPSLSSFPLTFSIIRFILFS